ncbi:MAG TPA: rhomboid family intramembrane serine protease [Opitutaceae bacterium]|nr:rhomboid family intramembrane serine protease [Opitutaceae bacterium]
MPPADLADAGLYPTFQNGFDHGLVVLAAGEPFWLVSTEGGYRLLVPPGRIDEIRRQLRCFDRESTNWPPPPIEPPSGSRPVELITPLLWALVVLAVYWGEAAHPSWVERGALDANAVVAHGEWWRAFTALFLHADAEHVASNGLIGLLAFSAMITTLGRARGWLLVLVASIVANLSVAVLNYPGSYRSIGASTAVFAAVGLLTGRALRVIVRQGRPIAWRTLFVPLVSGGTVLALYGAGGVHVDVMAHAAGFLIGILVGFAAGLVSE